MRPMLVVPPTAVERIEPLLRAAGWRAMSLPGEGEADRDAVFDAVARGDPVVSAPDRGAPAVRLRRIMVVHQGSRGDRAGMDLADEAALTSGAEVVVVHVPSAVADPTAGSLAFRIADRGGTAGAGGAGS